MTGSLSNGTSKGGLPPFPHPHRWSPFPHQTAPFLKCSPMGPYFHLPSLLLPQPALCLQAPLSGVRVLLNGRKADLREGSPSSLPGQCSPEPFSIPPGLLVLGDQFLFSGKSREGVTLLPHLTEEKHGARSSVTCPWQRARLGGTGMQSPGRPGFSLHLRCRSGAASPPAPVPERPGFGTSGES